MSARCGFPMPLRVYYSLDDSPLAWLPIFLWLAFWLPRYHKEAGCERTSWLPRPSLLVRPYSTSWTVLQWVRYHCIVVTSLATIDTGRLSILLSRISHYATGFSIAYFFLYRRIQTIAIAPPACRWLPKVNVHAVVISSSATRGDEGDSLVNRVSS